MRFNPPKNAVLPDVARRATTVVTGFLIASTAWAESNIVEGVDWVVDGQVESTGELSISLVTEPTTFVYGDVVDATIDVANGTNEDRQVVIKALLGELALFVRGDSGVRFEQPTQAENQRRLEWPTLFLPARARGRVTFQFLVNWHSSSDYAYIQVDALDPTNKNPPVVTHLREMPQYPAGGGGFLEQYAYLLVTVVLGAGLLFAFWRAQRRFAAGDSIASSLSGICMGVGTVFVVLFASIIWSEFEAWLSDWQETTCTILDVRYSKVTHYHSRRQGPSTPVHYYSGCLALSFEGPEGPVIASGYRHQSSISSPDIMNKYRAGSEAVCYYDPAAPTRVIVERALNVSSLVKASAFFAVGLLLAWFGYRSSSTATSSRFSDQPNSSIQSFL